MSDWNVTTFDEAIVKALDNGFNDYDFNGWMDLPPEDRLTFTAAIIEHNGVGQIIFRKKFAFALWGDGWKKVKPAGIVFEGKPYLPATAWEWHLTQMVVAQGMESDQDSWLLYLKEHM